MQRIDRETYHDHRFQNRLQTVLLIATMLGLLGLLGWLLGGWIGLAIGAFCCLVVFSLSRRVSPRLVLRVYRAQKIRFEDAPQLMTMFQQLAERAELNPAPDLYYIRSRNPNAFAVGMEGNSAVAITDGIMRLMNAREMAGILAHEIAHIQNQDTRVMAIADSVSRIVGWLSQLAFLMLFVGLPIACMGFFSIRMAFATILLLFAPVFMNLLQLALSRSREFDADVVSAHLTLDPRGLASALAKLDRLRPRSLFDLFFPGRRAPEPAVLRTHPATKERVERLLKLEEKSTEIEFVGPVTSTEPRKQHLPPRMARHRPRPRIHRNGIWY